MRLLFVSDVHPDTPHISAVRLWVFACELARRGHEVVFITRATVIQGRAGNGRGLAARLAEHDWQQPLLIELSIPAAAPMSPRRSAAIFRRMRTAWSLLVRGGPQWRWSDMVALQAAMIAADVRPELIWTTFGHTSNLMAARALARAGKCPWVLDVKDNWELYVPKGLRRLMAWRTRGWSAMTANAEFTRALARKWQGQEATVVYSGVDDAFLQTDPESVDSVQELAVNLIGGLYDRDRLREILGGLVDWMGGLAECERSRVRIRYLGGDTDLFEEAAAGIIAQQHLDVPGYVAIGEMARLCRLALANMYVRHDGGFHHKLLELLACGRPAVVYPRESAESWELVERTGGRLLEVPSRAAVAESLAGICKEARDVGIEDVPLASAEFPYTWANRAVGLEAVFASVLAGKK